MAIITQGAIQRRVYWVEEVRKLSGDFGNDYANLFKELTKEIDAGGISVLIEHLRLCSSIPESYDHDSSEEKLYSKYTDSILSLSFKHLGLKSLVLAERADAADVEAFADDYSFVADAKAFRLSRTAKNQKDFKVQAMDGWKRANDYAMVVCPIYQLPTSSSQIYQQATTRNVCIFTYSHLALLLSFSEMAGPVKSIQLLKVIFETVKSLNPSKNAVDYWMAVNKSILGFAQEISGLWEIEKLVAGESIIIAKEEDLSYLSKQRERIMRMSHEEALDELIKVNKIESKIKIISSIKDNGLFSIK